MTLHPWIVNVTVFEMKNPPRTLVAGILAMFSPARKFLLTWVDNPAGQD